jgi:hypothetical protein
MYHYLYCNNYSVTSIKEQMVVSLIGIYSQRFFLLKFLSAQSYSVF